MVSDLVLHHPALCDEESEREIQKLRQPPIILKRSSVGNEGNGKLFNLVNNKGASAPRCIGVMLMLAHMHQAATKTLTH